MAGVVLVFCGFWAGKAVTALNSRHISAHLIKVCIKNVGIFLSECVVPTKIFTGLMFLKNSVCGFVRVDHFTHKDFENFGNLQNLLR